MEFYIQINPVNPKELKEYLEILDEKGLIDHVKIVEAEEQQPTKNEEPIENNWTTNDYPTFEDVRAKMVALNRRGFGKKLIEILNKYGADKVSALSEEHYPAVLEDMEVLENESIS